MITQTESVMSSQRFNHFYRISEMRSFIRSSDSVGRLLRSSTMQDDYRSIITVFVNNYLKVDENKPYR